MRKEENSLLQKIWTSRAKSNYSGGSVGVVHSGSQCISKVSGKEKEKVLYYLIPLCSFD
jgi:hypothetical protein